MVTLLDPHPVTSEHRTAVDQPALEHAAPSGFEVHLTNFSGPFDLLLSLIAKHQLDITEIALAQVTDEFVAHIRDADAEWNLDSASEFLLIAATLLDLKAARLLPTTGEEDPEALELLEARDLLFARLIQYRAYKQISAVIKERFELQSQWFPRSVALEPEFAAMLPDLVWSIGPDELARIAASSMEPKPGPPDVDVTHLHAPAVNVHEQAAIIAAQLQSFGPMTFRGLIADAEGSLVVVGRFLALLELFRESLVDFDQLVPLGELTVRWTGPTPEPAPASTAPALSALGAAPLLTAPEVWG